MWQWFTDSIGWMYWTLPSVLFFVALFGSIALMGVWDAISPTPVRKGFLPIPTTRGDRYFIGIISGITIFLVWLGFMGQTFLYAPLGISAAWCVALGLKG
jgi:predicted small integral membrane protein